MDVLALNFGTSTLKFGLFVGERGEAAVAGVLEQPPSVEGAVAAVRDRLDAQGSFDAVAHRVVHGGPRHAGPVLVDAEVEREIESHLPLAPLHNALSLQGLRAARRLWPALPQVAVFDTAFHATMPEHAACYAVPAAWREAGLRRYGFHGLSHQHVTEAVERRMGVSARALRIVSCHLGNGASACAISGGRSVDTSMGLTPLEGLIMGTRSGDLDPGAAGYVARTLGLTLAGIEEALYGQSGLAALSGHGGDLRRIEAAAAAGDPAAELGLEAYAYRIRKYIGAYAAAMGGCDALAFTGGVGEHSAEVRRRVFRSLAFLGLQLDPGRNAQPQWDADGVAEVQAAASPSRILLVRAHEEWVLAREARRLLAKPDARG